MKIFKHQKSVEALAAGPAKEELQAVLGRPFFLYPFLFHWHHQPLHDEAFVESLRVLMQDFIQQRSPSPPPAPKPMASANAAGPKLKPSANVPAPKLKSSAKAAPKPSASVLPTASGSNISASASKPPVLGMPVRRTLDVIAVAEKLQKDLAAANAPPATQSLPPPNNNNAEMHVQIPRIKKPFNPEADPLRLPRENADADEEAPCRSADADQSGQHDADADPVAKPGVAAGKHRREESDAVTGDADADQAKKEKAGGD